MKDLTGFCERGVHEGCGGSLRGAVGFHWWCACECHPSPKIGWSPDHSKALNTWEAARAANRAETTA